MTRRGLLLGAILVLLFLTVLPCSSLNILLFKKSGAAGFSNPDVASPSEADRVECDHGIGKALADNGYSHTAVKSLPGDLKPYDVIFVTLGFAFLEAG